MSDHLQNTTGDPANANLSTLPTIGSKGVIHDKGKMSRALSPFSVNHSITCHPSFLTVRCFDSQPVCQSVNVRSISEYILVVHPYLPTEELASCVRLHQMPLSYLIIQKKSVGNLPKFTPPYRAFDVSPSINMAPRTPRYAPFVRLA